MKKSTTNFFISLSGVHMSLQSCTAALPSFVYYQENTMKKYLFLGCLLLMTALLSSVALSGAQAAEKKAGTRDLVFEEEDPEKAKVEPEETLDKQADIKDGIKVSVTMSLELQRDGKTDIVPPNSTFVSGDRVRLIYSTNADGYVYWLAKMTSGKYTVLFPTQKTGMDNAVKAGEKHNMPAKGVFRFDDKSGTEVLMCVVSPEKIADLDKAVADANAGGKDVDLNTAKITALEEMNLNKRKTRDLVFEETEDDKTNTKTQTAKKGEPFVAIFELQHD